MHLYYLHRIVQQRIEMAGDLEISLKACEAEINRVLAEIDEVKHQQHVEEEERVKGNGHRSEDRGIQLISHRKALEINLDKLLEEKAGIRTALRIVHEEKEGNEQFHAQNDKESLELARQLMKKDAADKSKADQLDADAAFALSLQDRRSIGNGNDHHNMKRDADDKLKADADVAFALSLQDHASIGNNNESRMAKKPRFQDDGDYDKPPAQERVVSIPLEKKKSPNKKKGTPSRVATEEVGELGDYVGHSAYYQSQALSVGADVQVFERFKDKPKTFLRDLKTKDGPPSSKRATKKESGPSRQNSKSKAELFEQLSVPNMAADDALPPSYENVLTEGTGHIDLVGTPYCTDCKQYLPAVKSKDTHILSGFLGKKKNAFKSRQSRWFVLAEGHLIYYILPEDFGMTFPNGVVHLDGTIITDPNPLDSTFNVERNRKKFNLKAPSIQEKREWMTQLRLHDKTFATQSNASKAVSSTGHFCSDCSSYVNMDEFTLAEIDGYLMKYRRSKLAWAKRWVVYSKHHLAYYDNLEQVKSYNPDRVIHVDPSKVHRPETEFKTRPLVFAINGGDRDFFFECPDENEFKEWMEILSKK